MEAQSFSPYPSSLSLLICLFTYLSVSDLSCGMQDGPYVMGDLPLNTQTLVLVRRLVVAAHGLPYPLARGILTPRPGIKPVFSTLQGRFLITGPSGKSLSLPF